MKKAAADAEQLISYNMPAIKLHGILVYCAAYEKHIGFYPAAKVIEAFKADYYPINGQKDLCNFL